MRGYAIYEYPDGRLLRREHHGSTVAAVYRTLENSRPPQARLVGIILSTV
jgi:hypothetical protein